MAGVMTSAIHCAIFLLIFYSVSEHHYSKQQNLLKMLFLGLIDLITLEEIIWTQGRGQNFVRRKLTEKDDGHKWETAMADHKDLVDTLSGLDDQLAETIIQQESLDLSSKEIEEAIRRCTISMKAFPILCGSSYKNIGVQTLMDGVVSYLPSPSEGHKLYRAFGTELAARAFKVQHDDQRGVLAFLRLYSGEISKGQKIYNLGQDKSELVSTILTVFFYYYINLPHFKCPMSVIQHISLKSHHIKLHIYVTK